MGKGKHARRGGPSGPQRAHGGNQGEGSQQNQGHHQAAAQPNNNSGGRRNHQRNGNEPTSNVFVSVTDVQGTALTTTFPNKHVTFIPRDDSERSRRQIRNGDILWYTSSTEYSLVTAEIRVNSINDEKKLYFGELVSVDANETARRFIREHSLDHDYIFIDLRSANTTAILTTETVLDAAIVHGNKGARCRFLSSRQSGRKMTLGQLKARLDDAVKDDVPLENALVAVTADNYALWQGLMSAEFNASLESRHCCLAILRLLIRDGIKDCVMGERVQRMFAMLPKSTFLQHSDGLQRVARLLNPRDHADAEVTFQQIIALFELAPTIHRDEGWSDKFDTLALFMSMYCNQSQQNRLQQAKTTIHNLHQRVTPIPAKPLHFNVKPLTPFYDATVLPSGEEFADRFQAARLPLNQVSTPYSNVDDYLHTAFHLLRADAFAALHEGLTEFRRGKLDPRDMHMYADFELKTMHFGSSSQGLCYLVKFTPVQAVKNWKVTNRLAQGNLLCISPDSTFRTLFFATVVQRDLDMLQNNMVAIKFVSGSATAFKAAVTASSGGGKPMMAESPTFYLAYGPVLRVLRDLRKETMPVKLLEHIVELRTDKVPPSYVASFAKQRKLIYPRQIVDHILQELGTSIELDANQRTALELALTHRLPLIQGPPGTGKSFLGRLIARALRVMDPGPILVITYKNHALDEFLEGLLPYHIKVVRVGGRSQKEALKKYNLSELVHGRYDKEDRKAFRAQMNDISESMRSLREELMGKRKAVTLSLDVLSCAVPTAQLNSLLASNGLEDGQRNESGVMEFNENEESLLEVKVYSWLPNFVSRPQNAGVANRVAEVNAISQLEIFSPGGSAAAPARPPAAAAAARYDSSDDEDQWQQDQEELEAERQIDASRETGSTGMRELINNQSRMVPLDQAMTGQVTGGLTDAQLLQCKDVWQLRREQRTRLAELWVARYRDHTLRLAEDEFNAHAVDMLQLQLLTKLRILQENEVIGMTTSGCAMHADLVRALRPKVVIVEEAAEVLEPQLIACLPSSVEHLILIGDHRQLQPSVACHDLEQVNQLNISMFERLIRNRLPHVTLTCQRRMLTDIAEMTSFIYAQQDPRVIITTHPTADARTLALKTRVVTRVPLMKAPVVFWTHDKLESASTAGRSKMNQFEVEAVVALTKKLVSKAVQPSSITVLTPYNGQLQALRSVLAKALPRHDGRPGSVIDCQTTDRYQGDENDVIILSLVRSNKDGKMGFLNKQNRMCVALSRARMQLVIIGNHNMFDVSQNSESWQPVIQALRNRECLSDTLQLVCPRHPHVEQRVPGPVELGGWRCNQDCNHLFQGCGHNCRAKCHDDDHKECQWPCEKKHQKCDHPCQSVCGKVPCPPCTVQVERTLPCTHKVAAACSKDLSAWKCDEPCRLTLNPCGHRCPRKCHEDCARVCDTVITTELPCRHSAKVKCHLAHSPELRNVHCDHPCTRTVCAENHPCDRQCGDTCPSADECPTCAAQREAERKEAIKAHRRYLKALAEKVDPTKSAFRPVAPDGDEYQRVLSWFHTASANPRLEVESITDHLCGDHQRAFLLGQSKVLDPRFSERVVSGPHLPDQAETVVTDQLKKGSLVVVGVTDAAIDGWEGKIVAFLLLEYNHHARPVQTSSGGTSRTCAYKVQQHSDVLVTSIVYCKVLPKPAAPSTRLLMPGEEQALQGTELRTFELEHRRFELEDANAHHWRRATAQFFNTQQDHKVASTRYKVTKVEYVVNPVLVRRFEAKRAEFDAKYPGNHHTILGFHGTPSTDNIQQIIRTNFDISRLGAATGNRGAYGAGIYFSEYSTVSTGYSQNSGQMLLNELLMGRPHMLSGPAPGVPLKEGCDSHTHNNGHEVVIFNADQILPRYIIHYETIRSTF